jgi:hypothetical protein
MKYFICAVLFIFVVLPFIGWLLNRNKDKESERETLQKVINKEEAKPVFKTSRCGSNMSKPKAVKL